MQTSPILALFHEPAPTDRSLSPFGISFLFHAALLPLLIFELHHTLTAERPAPTRYTVRMLNLKQQEEPKYHASDPGSSANAGQKATASSGSAGASGVSAPAIAHMADAVPALQTLVQPNLPPNLLLPKEVPVPQVLMWEQETTPLKKIVPPQTQTLASATKRPSLIAPNHEVRLADVKIAASVFESSKLPILPSTTTPVTVHRAEQMQLVQQTTSKSLEAPTPAAILSLSELQLKQGTMAVPLANQQAASTAASDAPANQHRKGTAPGNSGEQAGAGNGKANPSGSGGDRAGTKAGQGSQVASDAGGGSSGHGVNGSHDQTIGAGSGAQPASAGNDDGERSVARIRVPRDGHFGVVVVGPSLAEDYPETVGIWNGRLAYSVYVHVGLTKSWILQYSLPRSVEVASAGSVARPEAPWPYDMQRPHFATGDANADAVMVHGFVNTSGKFEKLAVVFPPDMHETEFLLSALRQWQFRPATQNGQIAAVEVLLIIPDEEE